MLGASRERVDDLIGDPFDDATGRLVEQATGELVAELEFDLAGIDCKFGHAPIAFEPLERPLFETDGEPCGPPLRVAEWLGWPVLSLAWSRAVASGPQRQLKASTR